MFKKNGKGQSLGIVKVATDDVETTVTKESEQKPEEKKELAPVKE